MMKSKTTFCRICEALCGLRVDIEDDSIVRVAPDKQHLTTQGFCCVKGLHQHEIYSSPDRLTRPLHRKASGFEAISWEEALAGIGRKVRRIRTSFGPDAIGMYVGTAAGFSVLHPMVAQGFMTGLGSKSMYATATQDCANKFAVSRLMYGFPFTLPFPDVDRCRCLILVGGNPAISKFSFLQLPDPLRRLRDIEQRGGRVWVVDPRRTETAKAVGTHTFIRPGTDVFFYLSFLHEVFAKNGVRRKGLARVADGLEQIEQLVTAWSPERTCKSTGIEPAVLRSMVENYLSADGAALYCSTGVNMGGAGSLAYWLQEVINLVTGNLDRRGGTLVGHGIIDLEKVGRLTGMLMRNDRSRIGKLPSVNDCYPGGVLADEILTPGPGRLRALFVSGGNPLITMANSDRLRKAFAQLELLVCVDIQRGETAQIADYVLPATTPFERPDLPFVFPLLLGMQSRPYLQATRALVPPPGEARDETRIYTDLARACGVDLFGSGLFQRLLKPGRFWRPTQEHLLDAILRLTRQPSFKRLADRHPHGWLRPDHAGGDFLGKRVTTPSGRVQLAPLSLMEQAQNLESLFVRLVEDQRLRLITRRAVRTHNSWTHNIEGFVSGSRNTNHLYLHPNDAAKLGLKEGDLADVRSEVASVRVPVRLLDDLMPGVVALPHGWGHQHAPGLSVASQTQGVNANLLAADGPDALEPLSGMAHLTGIPVEVTVATGPQDPKSWSGC